MEFIKLIGKCRELDYLDRPDYNYLHRTLKKIMVKNQL